MSKKDITMYYVLECMGEIEEYSLEQFCDLFNGENCGYNPETGESDETLISDNNFVYLTKKEALKKCKELKKNKTWLSFHLNYMGYCTPAVLGAEFATWIC